MFWTRTKKNEKATKQLRKPFRFETRLKVLMPPHPSPYDKKSCANDPTRADQAERVLVAYRESEEILLRVCRWAGIRSPCCRELAKHHEEGTWRKTGNAPWLTHRFCGSLNFFVCVTLYWLTLPSSPSQPTHTSQPTPPSTTHTTPLPANPAGRPFYILALSIPQKGVACDLPRTPLNNINKPTPAT